MSNYCIIILNFSLHEASIDAAVLTPTHIPQLATGVEICKCPPKYNSTSCQDPSIGHYRWYNNTTVTSTIVINLIGESIPCQCNGRSDICDIETGHCLVRYCTLRRNHSAVSLMCKNCHILYQNEC